jgi:small ligand-binding sensory domain FIST
VGAGLSTERDAARAAAEAADAALRSGGFARADALLVFATTPHGPGFTRVTRVAGETAGTHEVVGCSAAGVIADDQEIEGGAGVAVLALAGDIVTRRFFVPLTRGGAERAAAEVAAAVADVVQPGALLLLFADSYHFEADPFFAALAERLPGVDVVGGGASEDGSVGQVSVFAGDTASSAAVAGLVLTGDVLATVGVTQAVRRVGPVYRVTSARGNWILELDGRPAYEALTRVVPEPLLGDLRRALTVILAGLPLEDSDGEFVARHLTGADALRGAIAVAVPVPEGAPFFFGVRDPVAAREDLQSVLAREAAARQDGVPAGALYITCVGRGRGFYGVSGLDTAYIRQHLGPVPVAGFFSGAEFATGGSTCRLHQYSGVLATLSAGR